MEKAGLVSPMQGNGNREVLAPNREGWRRGKVEPRAGFTFSLPYSLPQQV
jgi:hypothetical protein